MENLNGYLTFGITHTGVWFWGNFLADVVRFVG